MDKPTRVSGDELNAAAMKIIMLAGDARNLMTEAMKDMLDGAQPAATDEMMKQAGEKIAEAHHVQTDMIQSTIEDDELQTTLLFSHAQDTLMTVYSELHMIGHMMAMYRRLLGRTEQ